LESQRITYRLMRESAASEIPPRATIHDPLSPESKTPAGRRAFAGSVRKSAA
jgi:hypothetical protein